MSQTKKKAKKKVTKQAAPVKPKKERKSLGILEDFKVKGYSPKDFNYVSNAFLAFSQSNTALGRSTSKTVFMKEHHKLLRSVVQDSRVYIATDKEGSDLHAGFIIAQKLGHIDIVHFLYVKEKYRNEGIGQLLLDQVKRKDSCIVTHKTKDSIESGIFEKNWKEVIYNPYMFLNGDYRDN